MPDLDLLRLLASRGPTPLPELFGVPALHPLHPAVQAVRRLWGKGLAVRDVTGEWRVTDRGREVLADEAAGRAA